MCGCVLKLSELYKYILLFPQITRSKYKQEICPRLADAKFISFSNFLPSEVTSIYSSFLGYIFSKKNYS